MSQIYNHRMRDVSRGRGQDGFSVIELIVATTIMLVVVGAVFSLMRDSMKVAMTTYEMTDAQQNLRISQEFINRDVMNAGDGLRSISTIRVPAAFVTSYITLNPVPTPSPAGIVNLAIFTTDNNVPANTAVTGAVPAANIRTGTDRQTILEIDPEFEAISLGNNNTAINATGSTITLPATPADLVNKFTVGEVYFLTSSVGSTFGVITAIDTGARQLTFAATDAYGLNNTGAGGHIRFISNNGTLATSLQRMKIIQYYVTSTGLLMRRVFGLQGAGVRDSIIAEHVLDVQFNYSLITTDDATGVVTPSASTSLTTSEQQLAVRQVEVRVTVETPHAIQNGARQPLTMTTSTSVRNMQFRKAL